MSENLEKKPWEKPEGLNEEIDKSDEVEQQEAPKKVLVVRDGDIFMRQNGSIDMAVLECSNMTDLGRFHKVRLYATAIKPFVLNDNELINYINANELEKMETIVDQLESVDFNFSLFEGDTFTQNGEFFMEILSDEMDYLNPIGENTRVIGVRDASGISYRDAIYIKSKLLGNCDQYPAENFMQTENEEKGE